MKKIIIILIWFIISNCFVFSINEKNIEYLEDKWINISDKILSKNQVSRYEAVKHLNFANCFDCTLPPQNIKENFNYGWFNEFKKKDRFYLNDIWPQDKYYYCIVNFAQKDYIHWYPSTNNICWGEFCWSNTLSYSELLQINLNILSNDILWNYEIKNKNIFYNKINSIKWKKEQLSVNITNEEIKLAKKIKNTNWLTYNIKTFDEFYLYQKYCSLYPWDCWFKEFWEIKKWNYLLSLVNILYDENILSFEEALNLNPYRKANWEDLINLLYKLKKLKTCKIDNDYDKDDILNENDNCIYNYNPSQTDTDKDKIWDVCDDDIDNDWIKNPIWIVNYDWNINAWKITKNMDNCLFIKNKNQKDKNLNNIWDVCENSGKDIIWIQIECLPLNWNVPAKKICKSETKWDIKKIIWSYNWKKIWEWRQINYKFFKEWKHKIIATAIWKNNDTSKASSFLKIWKKQESLNLNNFSIEVSADPISALPWSDISFYPNVQWDFDYLQWDFWDWSIYKKYNSNSLVKNYTSPWVYDVKIKAFKDWVFIWYSYLSIKINKNANQPSAILKSSNINSPKNSNVNFFFTTKNIDINNVSKVEWNFWDGTKKTTQTIKTNHTFNSWWSKIVTAKIYLNNWKSINWAITQHIFSDKKQEDKSYWANIIANPLWQYIWDQTKYKINTKWFWPENIDKIIWNFQNKPKQINKKLTNTNIYYNPWKKKTNVDIILNNKEIVTVELTQTIQWTNICLEKNNSLKCDLDNDWTKDVCDDDIDWDWIWNISWLIKYENHDCSITKENINIDKLKKQEEIIKKGWEKDNCPFKNNIEQIDTNKNGIWDKCEDQDIDTDQDWIVDSEDYCKEIPENINGIEDEDGCPELKKSTNKLKIKVENCNTCPCHFADYGSYFQKGSQIKAFLVNPFNTKNIYTTSEEKIIK